MRVTPKTDSEIAREGLIPPGVYDFEIVGAENKESRAGNEMIVLTLKVFDQDGNARTIYDYLLEAFARKLRHAVEACGLLSRYEGGELFAIDFEGKTGKVRIAVQEDKTGQFQPRNSVADYVVQGSTPLFDSIAPSRKAFGSGNAARGNAKDGDLNDEIPF